MSLQESFQKGITGNQIKWIAIVTMLIDHIAATLIERGILGDALFMPETMKEMIWLFVYLGMRIIGRIAFPIFCFLIVQGVIHTRNIWKYALRMLLFALLAEIPFDLALKLTFFDFSYQNVLFTMLVGILTLAIFRLIHGKKWYHRVLQVLVIVAGMALAYVMKTDYAAAGVACIVTIYLLREHKLWMALAATGALVVVSGFNVMEMFAGFGFLFVALYNGKRGGKGKYFFYLFYPLHLLILGGILYLGLFP